MTQDLCQKALCHFKIDTKKIDTGFRKKVLCQNHFYFFENDTVSYLSVELAQRSTDVI